MNRVAFEIFGLPIMWYGIIIATAMAIAYFLVVHLAKKKGISEEIITDWFLWTIPLSVIGARIYYVIFEWENYKGDFFKIINIRGGGLAIHGGIITGIIVTIIFCKKKGLSFWSFVDLIAPALVLAQGIGRWGNFANQEAHGGPTDLPWGIMIEGVKVHPTFFYEFVANVGICIFLLYYSKKKKFEGELFLIYVFLYSFFRYFIEGLRTDSLYVGPFRTAQLVSAIGMGAAVGIYAHRRKKYSK
ncbi:MAG: prolipoprotein diacylglyceryl transferase [Tissierellia bacterium]|nr:prolipoprotein diacylglyceryl transferase [Tissierellia bacterium]